MVKNFHKFVINEKNNPDEGGSSIRRGKDKLDQDKPSKSGIEYKKNMSYSKSDTGRSSANAYLAMLKEAIGAIDEMTSIVASMKPELAKYSNSKKIELGSALENSLDSHISLWKGLESLASYLYENMPKSPVTKDIISKHQGEIQKMKKDRDSGVLSREEYTQKEDEIKKIAREELDKAKNVYYSVIKEALPYFVEAVKAFKSGAILEIKNVDKEEAKENDIKSESNFTNWLEQATNIAIKILYKNK